MNTEILLDMLFEFLEKRKVTAGYLAEKYTVSERTVYRYVDALSQKIPIFVKRGRTGGICLSDSYRLPVGFMSKDEYTALLDALQIAYAKDPNPCFMNVRRRLSAQLKSEQRNRTAAGESGEFFIEEPLFTLHDKIEILHECLQRERLAEIEYLNQDNELISSKIEPHAFLFQDGIWVLYAFCHVHRDFQIFTVGRIRAVMQSDEPFRKRHFTRQDIPLIHPTNTPLSVTLEIADTSIDFMRNRVGVENLHQIGGKWIANVALPEENAVQILLSWGIGIKVISPLHIREKLLFTTKNILKNYP